MNVLKPNNSAKFVLTGFPFKRSGVRFFINRLYKTTMVCSVSVSGND